MPKKKTIRHDAANAVRGIHRGITTCNARILERRFKGPVGGIT